MSPPQPNQRIAVCSWSLRPWSPADLVDRLRAVGISRVQLALDPIRTGAWSPEPLAKHPYSRGPAPDPAPPGVHLISGMIGMKGEDYSSLGSIRATGGLRPDATWPDNLAAARDSAALAARLGLPLVTFHAGFLPTDPSDPFRAEMLTRLRAIADTFAARGIRVGLETGQESAPTLLSVLADLDRPNVGVNFDPANMILYGMGDPVDAFRRLARFVVQVHIKDAVPTQTPGTWGTEVPVGRGAVDWRVFLADIRRLTPEVALVIERESGSGMDRTADIVAARELLQSHGFSP